jgi:hypothetical protein
MPGVKHRRLWRRIALLSGSFLLCPVLLATPVAAQSGVTVDVGTDRGGEGRGTFGGTYTIGESTGIWVRVSGACNVEWTLTGPGVNVGDSSYFPSADTYSLELGVAEASDVGTWTFAIRATSGSVVATDSVQFQVVTAGQPTPAATPVLTAATATALDALKALKMSQGTLAVDLSLDVDSDGSVPADDARLILEWAVQ